MFKSIRHGLFAALAGFTLLICLCYTGLALVVAYVTEDMLVDRIMTREAAAVTAGLRAGEGAEEGAAAPGSDLIRVYRGAAALPPAVRQEVLAGRTRAEVFTGTNRHYHLRTLDIPGTAGPQRIYLVADAGPLLVVSQLVREVGAVVALVAVGLVGLALLLAWRLSTRLVAPLQALADEVRHLKPGDAVDFGARVRRDEIGYLADKLGTTLGELHAALARERAFTRDVGHELRTPLTVMRNTLAPAAARSLDEEEAAQLRAGLDELGNTVDVLFALARAEHVGSEVFDLRACIEDTLLRQLGPGGWDAGRIEFVLPERLFVRGNRHLALLLVTNCLGNALFHGGPGARLRLSYVEGTMSIANSIAPGRPASPQGFLHGHNLLTRIGVAMGWALRFHPGAHDYQVDVVPLRPD